MPEKDQTKIVPCMTCGRGTHHKVVAEYKTSGTTPDDEIRWCNDYQILVCLGCDSVSFCDAAACSEDFDEYGGILVTNTLYPNRTSGRSPIGELNRHTSVVSQKIQSIYIETIKAMNSDCPTLSAVGIRALIESICIDQNAQGGNLEKRIDNLSTMGLLAKKQTDALHSIRFLGNAAAHEIEEPYPQELITALEIAETLLKTIYILPQLDASIKTGRKTP